ncbi:MAG: hypothetical protein LBS20_17635 [Prevotella sp.]|jgi:hypothetical protein|nr:hypothetical protein [Prevotella sp.]
MNNVLNLFKGVGVIVDDDLRIRPGRVDQTNKKHFIWKIEKSFKSKNIPLLLYSELPDDQQIQNFCSISFLLLDWDLIGLEDGTGLPDAAIKDNIEFIKQFNKVCFAPVFIFSNEDTDYIKSELINAGLYDNSKSNHIFVESKSNLKQSRTLFNKIKKWIEKTPSLYVLKEWEQSLFQAKHDLFWDFYITNPMWANILKQTFQSDGVDENHELGALLYKNLIARTTPVTFNEAVLKPTRHKATKEDLRKVLECERYLKNDKIPDIPAIGDIFKENSSYYINIRPDCDIVRKGDNVKLYCLKGSVIKEQHINAKKKSSKIIFEKGTFIEKAYNTYVSFVDDGKIIEFKFNDNNLIQEEWKNLKDKRIGRLLPPYITRLQQKYAFYLQRQGLPAIPYKAIK